MLKKLVPVLCLLIATAAIVVCLSLPVPVPDVPADYPAPYFEGVVRNSVELEREITTARLAVRNDSYSAERAKYFEPEIKAVLLDVRDIVTPAAGDSTDAPVIVYIDGITEEKIAVFAECFPYNHYIFREGELYTVRYTKDVVQDIRAAQKAVKQYDRSGGNRIYFNRDIKAVLDDLLYVSASGSMSLETAGTVSVKIRNLTDQKAETLKKYFPYDFYEFDGYDYDPKKLVESTRVLSDVEGKVETKLVSLTPTGMEYMIRNTTEGEVFKWDEYYTIERLKGGKWYEVQPITDGGMDSIFFERTTPAGMETQMKAGWEYFYGELPRGRYRLVKTLWVYHSWESARSTSGTPDDIYTVAIRFRVK